MCITASAAKKQTAILSERNEKRELVGTLSDKIMSTQGNMRFRDKNYDDRFTPELFRDAMKRFSSLDLKELHYASVRDIIEHREENQYLFEQVHDMEHLLFVATQRDLAPSDDEIDEVIDKTRAFLEEF